MNTEKLHHLIILAAQNKPTAPAAPRQPGRAAGAALVLCLTVLMAGCGGNKNQEIVEDSRGAQKMYDEAKSSLNAHDFGNAIIKYKALQSRYPFGRHAEQAQLDLAYAYYKSGEPENVTSTLDRFVKTFPSHPNVDYAYYLKGLSYYEQNIGFLQNMFPQRIEDRDQSGARQAFDSFSELIRLHPESRYTPDARQRMVFLRNNLAAYEIAVARYYLKRKAYIAAVNRARYVLETYPGTYATGDALATMVRAYTALDMPELAADAKRVLELNDPDHPYLLGKEEKESFFSRLWVFD